MEFELMLTPREKGKMSPEEDRTRDTVDSEPNHYQLSYSGPPKGMLLAYGFSFFWFWIGKGGRQGGVGGWRRG